MTNRREFIQGGVALSAASPVVLGSGRAPASPTGPHLHPVLVVFDRRYAEGRLFAHAAEAAGLRTRGIEGDVTSLWYDDLYHRWKAGPSPIVGLTGASSLFCLEQLAWKVERRVVCRVDHRPRSDGRIDHELQSAAPLARLLTALESETQWPLWSAAAVRELPERPRRGQKFTARVLGPAMKGSDAWEEPLVTWAITLKPVA